MIINSEKIEIGIDADVTGNNVLSHSLGLLVKVLSYSRRNLPSLF